jgi:hypothetical protein
VPGTPAPFKVRGSSYLADRTKVDGGVPQFVLGSVDLVETPGPTQHISRFLPAVRCNQAAYSFVVNLIIPGTPVLSLVAVFINEHHPDILGGGGGSSSSSGGGSSEGSAHGAADQQPRQACALERLSTVHAQLPGAAEVQQQGAAAAGDADEDAAASSYTSPVCEQPPDGAAALERGSDDSAAAGGSNEEDGGGGSYQRPRDTADWQPFDFVLHRFLHGDGATRQAMFKLIPHIAEGSWVIKQSVGTVPVILGNKLQTVYYETERYIEATVDVTSSSAAAYITGARACARLAEACCRCRLQASGVRACSRPCLHSVVVPLLSIVGVNACCARRCRVSSQAWCGAPPRASSLTWALCWRGSGQRSCPRRSWAPSGSTTSTAHRRSASTPARSCRCCRGRCSSTSSCSCCSSRLPWRLRRQASARRGAARQQLLLRQQAPRRQRKQAGLVMRPPGSSARRLTRTRSSSGGRRVRLAHQQLAHQQLMALTCDERWPLSSSSSSSSSMVRQRRSLLQRSRGTRTAGAACHPCWMAAGQ